MATRMQQRRGTAAQWISTNSGNGPVLNAGEIGFESDTNKFKIGDGVNHWLALSYFSNTSGLEALLNDGAPAALNTLNEIAAAINDDPAFFTTTANSVALKAPIASPTFTGTVGGITKAMVGLGSVDNSSDLGKPVSTAQQTALDLKAPLASPTFTGTVAGITKAMVGLENVDNTTDANKPISTNTQSALDLKAPIASPTFTGTVGGVTKTHVGLGNVDNTSDASKPVSSATQTAIDFKAPIDAPTFTGTVTSTNDVVVNGNLTVNGTTFNASSTSITIEDNMLQLAHQNAANTVDLGLVVGYNDGAAKHAGLVRDVSESKWKLFSGVTTEPTTTVDFSQASLDSISVGPLEASSANIGDVSNTEIQYLNGVTSAIQTQLDAKLSSTSAGTTYAPLASPTFTGTVSGITKTMVGLGNVDNSADIDKDISTLTQAALNLKAPLASPTFTGTVTLPSGTVTSGMILDGTVVNADINASAAIDWTKLAISSTVDSTEIGYVNGVTSAIQTQIDAKLATADAASTYQQKVVDVSDTEISYLNGVTGGIQGQIDLKAPIASPTFTGTVSGVTKSMVGLTNVDDTADSAKPISTATQTALDAKLASATAASTYAPLASPTFTGTVSGVTATHVGLGNVDNTSDANKPISTATQTALDLKSPLASPTFTGTLTASDVVVNGDFTVNGTNFSASATSITIEDNLVQLAHQNAANTVDLGLVVGYNDGAAKHAGLVRDVSDAKWKLFKGVTSEPSTTVDFTQGSLDDLKVAAFEATTVTPSSGVVFSDGTQTKEGTPSRKTISQKTDSYTLSSLTERDSMIEISKATAVTLTVPVDATVNYPVGTSIDILQTGAGQITIAPVSGSVVVNATPGLKLRAQWSSATLLKRAANTWVLIGDLTA